MLFHAVVQRSQRVTIRVQYRLQYFRFVRALLQPHRIDVGRSGPRRSNQCLRLVGRWFYQTKSSAGDPPKITLRSCCVTQPGMRIMSCAQRRSQCTYMQERNESSHVSFHPRACVDDSWTNCNRELHNAHCAIIAELSERHVRAMIRCIWLPTLPVNWMTKSYGSPLSEVSMMSISCL